MKAKKELVLATYKDYVRHYGVKLGAKKWKEKDLKIGKGKKERVYESKPVEVNTKFLKLTEEVKDVPIEQTPLQKAEGDVEYRGIEIRKMLRTKGWYRYLKPEIELIIKEYKDQYDNVNNIVELKVNQKIRKILRAMLDYPKDCLEDAEIVKKERKEREDAINSGGS